MIIILKVRMSTRRSPASARQWLDMQMLDFPYPCEVVSAREEKRPGERWVSVADIMGSNVVPEGVADVMRRAIDAVKRAGVDGPAWRAVEMIAADFVAGA